MNMGLCYFNWLSVQFSVCVAGLLEREGEKGEKRERKSHMGAHLRTKWRDIVF